MSQLPVANQSPKDVSSETPKIEPGFEVTVQAFWDKNRGAVLGALGLVVVGIVGWWGWNGYQQSKEAGIREEYAKIGSQTSKLAAFADANSSHVLAGVARVRLADEKYSAGDYRGAATLYSQAASSLKNDFLLGRAKLGAAISQLNAGDTAAGEAALKAVSADSALTATARAEAAYHLATVALDAGKVDEAKKQADEANRLEPSGPWAQRATMLLATLPTAPGATPATPATEGATPQFKIGG